MCRLYHVFEAFQAVESLSSTSLVIDVGFRHELVAILRGTRRESFEHSPEDLRGDGGFRHHNWG